MKQNDQSGQKSPSKKSKKQQYQKYSYSLKRKVVYEIESGKRRIEEARLFYGIKSKSVIYTWLKQYGKLTYDPKKTYQMKKTPQERIKELEEKLEISELEKDIMFDIMEAYEEEGVDVKKSLPALLAKEYAKRKNTEPLQ